MIHSFAIDSWDEKERKAVDEVLQRGQLTMGAQVHAFEQAFARAFKVKYAVMVNSGSSASLLAASALRFSKRRPLHPGDEVLVPALAWGTSLAPFQQCGLRIKCVDVDPNTLNLDVQKVESAITSATRCILTLNALGAASDFDKIIALCDRHQLLLLEDNCDSIGASYKGKLCGTFGLCAAFSLSQNNQISTGEGGVVVTNEEEIYHILLALRSYGSTEHLPRPNKIDHKKGDRLYEGARFLFPGYNVRPTEIAGAIGLVQLEKLPHLLEGRRRNAERLQAILKEFPEIQLQSPLGESSWLSFALLLKEGLAGKREMLIEELTKQGIECRPILAGNITSHPFMSHLNHSIHGTLPQVKKIDKQGFCIANSHRDLSEVFHTFKQCLERVCAPALSSI